ncbi:MAG: hypothetical protein U0841_15735 [Chloroflexia bacterium]
MLALALLGTVATALSGAIGAILQGIGRFGRLAAVGLTNAALTAVLAVILAALGRLTLVTALVVLGIGTSLAAFIVGCALLPRDWRLGCPVGRSCAPRDWRSCGSGAGSGWRTARRCWPRNSISCW